MKMALLYAMLAAVATVANIGAQDLCVRLYSGSFSILISVFLGTAVGLSVKYVLDKRYIFRFRAHNVAHDGRTFGLYAMMGLLTTVVFWGFEFSFAAIFQSREMRYLGGVIGLTIGYTAKYHLDKRYVFKVPAAL